MSPPGGKDLTFKIFGLDNMGGEVPVDVFAKKISEISRALKKVDKVKNGGKCFEYVVAGLEYGSAKIDFREKTMTDKTIRTSPVQKFMSIGTAVASGRLIKPEDQADEIIIDLYDSLSKDASKGFSYGTLRGSQDELVRVDRYLNSQVARVLAAAKQAAQDASPQFYVGGAIGSFTGVIQAVDLKGDAPEVRLVLSAGGKSVNCVLFGMDLDEVRAALGSKVSVTGRAIYEGRSGLPSRIEIRRIQRFSKNSILGLSGSIKPFQVRDWDGLT